MASRFREGDRVRVKDEARPGHVRTPAYIVGKTGLVERIHGTYRNPEQLAYGGDGLPKVALYYVRFDARDVWGDRPGSDTLAVDIYEHWLEPA
jgi:nitrile hydratase subunit beta